MQDVVVRLGGPIRHGTDTPSLITHRRGGSAANVAVAAARLDRQACFIGQIGADPTGDALLADLSTAGVEVRGGRGGRSGTVVALVDATAERSMLTDRGSCAELADPRPAWLDGLSVLHVPLYSFGVEPLATTALALVNWAHARAIDVSIDASSVALIDSMGRDAVLDLLRRLAPKILLCNEDEARCLLTDGTGGTGRALAAEAIVVKQGPRPAIVHAADGTSSTVPVPPVPGGVRDTTGAGDAFAAGFLVARRHGAAPTAAALAGHAAAAAAITAASGFV